MANISVVGQLNPIGFYYNNRGFYVGCVHYGVSFANNPEYSLTNDFLAYCPEFRTLLTDGNGNEKSDAYTTLYDRLVAQANGIFDYRLFGTDWYAVMSYYIAHWFIKAAQRFIAIANVPNCSPSNIVSALGSLSVGVVTEENLGGEVLKTEPMLNVSGMEGGGDYLSTQYGRALWEIYKPYGKIRFIGRYGG